MTEQPEPLAETTRSDALAGAYSAEGWARALVERQLWMLGRLAEGGLEIAQAIERQATGSDDGRPARDVVRGDIASAYARVARAVRMTILLQSKLMEDLQKLDKLDAHQVSSAKSWADVTRPRQRSERKASVKRVIERIARAGRQDNEVVELLVQDAAFRLDQDDIYGDLLSCPVSETIARICKDLGLAPDWPRLAEEAWARAEIASGCPGSPLAALKAQGADPDPGRRQDTHRPLAAPDPVQPKPHAASP